MAICKAEAIVLNRHNFRETSLIASFFTREFGKISGLLKGIKEQPEKFASTVEPFSHNDIIFYQKRNSSLHLVSACDMKDSFDYIRQNLSKVGIASAMMELLEHILPAEDKNEGVFNLALESLRELKTIDNADKILTIFKIKILALSGFKPHLDSCVVCQDKILGNSKFSLTFGGLLCPQCCHKDTSSRLVFRGTVASILHIEKNELRNNLSLGMNPQIKRELNHILNSFLNFHVGKELKSQRVLDKLAVVTSNEDVTYGGIT